MSAASFDFAVFVEAVADGAELGDAVGSVVAEAEAAVGRAVADRGGSVRAASAGGCGPAMYPAIATPAASTATSAKGASVENAPRLIDGIFIEPNRSLESNGAQRRCRDTTRV
jgi:hypothetical protein